MSGEGGTVDTLPGQVQYPNEVQWYFIVVPLLLSALVVAGVLAYRCRAHRLRRERLEQEQEQELREMKAAREMEVGGAPGVTDPHGSAATVGLGNKYYMSAYKKLLQQA